MGGPRIALVAVAALGAAAIPGVARAQPRDPGGEIEMGADPAAIPAADAADPAVVKDPKLAKKWLAAAQQLMQKAAAFAANNRPDDARAQLENAVTAYQRAIEAGDDASLYLELAAADEKLGRLDAAVKHLRRVIAASAGVRPENVKKATARLEDLSARVGLVTLSVTPAGASITLGGIALGTSPLPEPLVLMPGTYMLAFQAAGFQPKEAAIKVDAGSEAEHAIALDPVTVVVAPVGPARRDEPLLDDSPGPSTLPLWIGRGRHRGGHRGRDRVRPARRPPARDVHQRVDLGARSRRCPDQRPAAGARQRSRARDRGRGGRSYGVLVFYQVPPASPGTGGAAFPSGRCQA
jgi:PEGA domain-containing protein